MKRLLALIAVAALAIPAHAHFIWLVPQKAGMVQMVFSDELAPDANVPITKIAQTQVFARSAKGDVAVTKKEANDHYVLTFDASSPVEVAGVCQYGVLAKKGDPYLLNYYTKASIGTSADKTALGKGWSKLPLEIVVIDGSKGEYHVLWQGKPVADVEVVAMIPGIDEARKPAIAKAGNFNLGPIPPDSKGSVGIRARYIEKKSGELQGAKYGEVRHYTTWTFDLPK
jgi:uncharacterized GH25 family protein